VTVRVRQGLPSLRSESLFRCVLAQLRASRDRFIRILHFSVQSNHVHLLIEAQDGRLLGRGMKGFAVRVARNLNRLLALRGTVWDERYHARSLSTPREVRNALIYVLRNRVKHVGDIAFDRCSSAAYLLGGWGESMYPPDARGSPDSWPVALPESWLVNVGWKRLGRIGLFDVPAA
jgi:putative transposase